MRIVEPNKFVSKKETKKTNRRLLRWLFVAIVVLIISVATYISLESSNNISGSTPATTAIEQSTDIIIEPEKSGPREFGGNEFRLLYDNLLLPNTDKVDTPPVITGNDIADARIRQIAESRGYKLRRIASINLPVLNGYPLQSVVGEQWKKLQSAASEAGLVMSVVSAYRSVDDQRILFNSRLQAEGVSVADVASGVADAEINEVLVSTAIPGYSKHHSGYTIDILCEGWVFEDFKNSECHQWLIADNYLQAKQFGFIPSYPIDADLQGPDPEAWEYVYVGEELLNY